MDYGIDLKLESFEEENYYITQMCDYFNDKTDFKAYLSGDRSFEVEYDRETPILEVIIKDSHLTILPYVEDIFEVFTLILGFIAKNHQDIIAELRGTTDHLIQDPSDVGSETTGEEDSSDDYEWI